MQIRKTDMVTNLFGLLWGLEPGSLEPDVLRLGADLAALHDEVARGLHLPRHLLQARRGDPGRRMVRVRLPATKMKKLGIDYQRKFTCK